MRVVIALGGNALLRRGQPLDTELQRANLREAASAIAEVADEHQIVVTHGNGPQVGLLALQAAAYEDAPEPPLDVLGAESEGMVGYLIDQELSNALPDRQVVTLLTQVEVDANDPAFDDPTKPIGPFYDADRAGELEGERGWSFAEFDAGYRRIVPSPEPRRIRELDTIRVLLQADRIVVCAGGGGIPVVVTPARAVRGVEAVIDKDRSAALLAARLNAHALLLLTDVPGVYPSWPPGDTPPITTCTPEQLEDMRLERGSMGPKVEAACRFVRSSGGIAGIGALADAARILRGEAGTRVQRAVE
ncbi:MAG: carbamate kinase [Planctomycetota bacterium]|nr:carbamate kinase [Planctomycetota bacterium]